MGVRWDCEDVMSNNEGKIERWTIVCSKREEEDF